MISLEKAMDTNLILYSKIKDSSRVWCQGEMEPTPGLTGEIGKELICRVSV